MMESKTGALANNVHATLQAYRSWGKEWLEMAGASELGWVLADCTNFDQDEQLLHLHLIELL
jgi:hypothetical protein